MRLLIVAAFSSAAHKSSARLTAGLPCETLYSEPCPTLFTLLWDLEWSHFHAQWLELLPSDFGRNALGNGTRQNLVVG